MTQLKSGQTPASWKERQINPGCEFGVKSYLHQFYDGPESIDLDLYEGEVCVVGSNALLSLETFWYPGAPVAS